MSWFRMESAMKKANARVVARRASEDRQDFVGSWIAALWVAVLVYLMAILPLP